ncbi:MAG: hypothetical protein QM780_17960 [Hyphomicrobium sp.]
MPYSFYAVVDALPQIAAAAFLPVIGIAFVSYMIKATRPHPTAKPAD